MQGQLPLHALLSKIRDKTVWQAWPIGLIVMILCVYLGIFDNLVKKAQLGNKLSNCAGRACQ